ncbi:8856_t:CDS:1 [Rhizophagus irregularis]|nr:8856_t:CDS:1 [Rhizophagus irregularis]
MLKVKIENKENGSKFHKDAHLDTKLSDFRKELEETDEINDKLSFSQKFDDDFAVEISRVNEDDFMLKDFMEEFTEGSNEIDMFLVTTTYWKFLNKLNQLDRGWMITSEGIERANKQALILHSAKIVEVNAVNAEKQVTVSYKYEKDMKRFYITDKNVPNFAGRSKKTAKVLHLPNIL